MAQRSDIVATRGLRVRGLARLDHLGIGKVAPASDEDLAVGFKSSRLHAGGEVVRGRGKTGLGRDDAVLHARFEDVLAPIEVKLIAESIAEAELDVREGS